ncbi:PorT family protein [bacterium]|nr:PorT family protein [bacterium]
MRIAILFLLMNLMSLARAQKLEKSIHVSYINAFAQNEKINNSYGLGFSVSGQFMHSINEQIGFGTEINYQFVSLNFVDHIETLCLSCNSSYNGNLKTHEIRVPLLLQWKFNLAYFLDLGPGISATIVSNAEIDHVFYRVSKNDANITKLMNVRSATSKTINPYFRASLGRVFKIRDRELLASLKYNYSLVRYQIYFEHPENVDREYSINFHQAVFSIGLRM